MDTENNMLVDVFPVGPIQANCTLLGDPSAGSLAIIDPGEEAERILERAATAGLEVAMVLHTHGHLDHAGGTADLVRRLPAGVPVGLHREELQIYRNLPMQGQMFGLEAETGPEPDLWLEHGQRIEIGSLSVEVRHTPGHSPGGVVFVVHGGPEKVAVVGDTIFAGSIGRTDLWGGSFETLERSIREQLYTLDEDTRLVCGHGPDTTVGREMRTNPFVQG